MTSGRVLGSRAGGGEKMGFILCTAAHRQASWVPVPPKFFPELGCGVPGAHHADDVWVDRLNEDAPGAPHTLHQLIERCSLHLLPLQVSHTIQEVKHHPALGQLPAQQLVQLRGWHIWGEGMGLSLGPSCHSSGRGRTLLLPQAASPGLRPHALVPSPTPRREQTTPVLSSILTG